MQIADNLSAHPPLPEHLSPTEQNSAAPPPVWWMRLRLESIYRRLEAIRTRMALLLRMRGQGIRSRRSYRRLAQEAAALVLAAGLLLTPAGSPLHAAAITVDGTTCTLAEAITSANADNAGGNGCVDGSGADTITLQDNVTLSAADNGYNGLPIISSVITIEGAGFTISRGGAPNFRLLEVSSSGNLTLNNATLSGGSVGDYNGGGIYNAGTLTVNNSTLSGNSAGADYGGGGIYNSNSGTLTVNNSTLSGNSAGAGGGIRSRDYGMLTVNNSTLSGNSAAYGGGGIFNEGTLTVNNSTLSDNSATNDAGGGIWNSGTLAVNNSTLSGNSTTNNHGGGIYNGGGTLTVNNSTLSGNSTAYDGGGIYNSGTLAVNNSTLSVNSATNNGGGIFNNGTLTVKHSLVSGNTAVSSGNEIHHSGGTVTANDFNLFGHNGETNAQAFSGFTPSSPPVGSDINATQNGTNVALGSILNTTLFDNGGPTMTHALVSGGPAIDVIPSGSRMAARSGDAVAASPVLCTPGITAGSSYDQRGVWRANTGGTHICDIGAFEFGITPTAVTIASFSSQTAFGSGPQLNWETADETGLSGFHIWRGSATAAESRLTDALIGAEGGLNGHAYTWQDDTTFGWGQREYYWLEAVTADGSSFTGPVEVLGIGKLFLPMAAR